MTKRVSQTVVPGGSSVHALAQSLFALSASTPVGTTISHPAPPLPARHDGTNLPSFLDLTCGAGFRVVRGGRLKRQRSLADTVGPNLVMLICGLNPSPSSADSGIGFFRAGNRFWPAALAAGIAAVDRDPQHMLTNRGIGMTDVVKRTTRKASELSKAEYDEGLARVERLVRWLEPGAICFVGLAGWRAVANNKAKAGVQPETLAERPVYLMPSTSGLNASSQLPDLTAHLIAAWELARGV